MTGAVWVVNVTCRALNSGRPAAFATEPGTLTT